MGFFNVLFFAYYKSSMTLPICNSIYRSLFVSIDYIGAKCYFLEKDKIKRKIFLYRLYCKITVKLHDLNIRSAQDQSEIKKYIINTYI